MARAVVANEYILVADVEEAISYLSALYERVTPRVERFTHGVVTAKRVKSGDFLAGLSTIKSEVRYFLRAVIEVEDEFTRRWVPDSKGERAASVLPPKFFGGGEDDVVLGVDDVCDVEDARDSGAIVNAVDDEIAAVVSADGQRGDTSVAEDVVQPTEDKERQKATKVNELSPQAAEPLDIPDEDSVPPAPFGTPAEPTSSPTSDVPSPPTSDVPSPPTGDVPSPPKEVPLRPCRSPRQRPKELTPQVAEPVTPFGTPGASTSSPNSDQPAAPKKRPLGPPRPLKRIPKGWKPPVPSKKAKIASPKKLAEKGSHEESLSPVPSDVPLEPVSPIRLKLASERPTTRKQLQDKKWRIESVAGKLAAKSLDAPAKKPKKICGATKPDIVQPESETQAVPPTESDRTGDQRGSEPAVKEGVSNSPVRDRSVSATSGDLVAKLSKSEDVVASKSVAISEGVRKTKMSASTAQPPTSSAQERATSQVQDVQKKSPDAGSSPTSSIPGFLESSNVDESSKVPEVPPERITKMNASSVRRRTSSAEKTAPSQVQQKAPAESSPTLLLPGLHRSYSGVAEAVSRVPDELPDAILDTSPPPSPSGVFRKPLKKRPLLEDATVQPNNQQPSVEETSDLVVEQAEPSPSTVNGANPANRQLVVLPVQVDRVVQEPVPLDPTPTASTIPVKRARQSTSMKTPPGAGEPSAGFPSNARGGERTPGMVGCSSSPAFFHRPWMPHHGTATPQQMGPGFVPNHGQFGPHMGPFVRPGMPSPACINQGVSYAQNNMQMGPSPFFGAGPSHGPHPGVQQFNCHPGGYQGFHSQQPRQNFHCPGQQQHFSHQGVENGGFGRQPNFGPSPHGPIFVPWPSPSAWNDQQSPHFAPMMLPNPRQHIRRDPSPLSEFGGVARCDARPTPPPMNCPVQQPEQPRFPVPMMAPSMQGRRVLLPTPPPTLPGEVHHCQPLRSTPTPSAPGRRLGPIHPAPGKSSSLKPGQSRPATPAVIDNPHASSPMTYPSDEPCQPPQNVASPMMATAGSSPNGSASMGASSTDP